MRYGVEPYVFQGSINSLLPNLVTLISGCGALHVGSACSSRLRPAILILQKQTRAAASVLAHTWLSRRRDQRRCRDSPHCSHVHSLLHSCTAASREPTHVEASRLFLHTGISSHWYAFARSDIDMVRRIVFS